MNSGHLYGVCGEIFSNNSTYHHYHKINHLKLGNFECKYWENKTFNRLDNIRRYVKLSFLCGELQHQMKLPHIANRNQ